VRKIATLAGLLVLIGMVSRANAQVTVGDDLKMNLNGELNGGYSGVYGDQIPSSHGLNFGGSGQLSGSYYNPNFLNFSVTPYYNQSRNDSGFQSLTDATGVNATANLFTGSRYPGNVSYAYTRNSTGVFGLIGTPNFTTIGSGQSFGIGWSALVPDWPTFSVSYSQGNGTGNIYGTNEESNSSTKTFNARSAYTMAGWNLNANYTLLKVDSTVPYFLSGEVTNDLSNSTSNDIGVSAYHKLPWWNGSVGITYNYMTFSSDFGTSLFADQSSSHYTTNTQSALVSFHPTNKMGLYANETFTDNLNGYFYQNFVNGGGGIPIVENNSSGNSFTVNSGVSYQVIPNLFTQAQITYFNQTYLGQSYNGSYISGTVGYSKRILDTFALSATVIESSNKFANNSLGFIGNLTAFRRFGGWEVTGGFSYAQNVQTLLVTYTTSYYTYNANLHRRLGRGKQWTGAVNGSKSGFAQYPGSENHSESFTTSLALRRFTLTANYVQASGQSILTSNGIQPIPPTPGLPPEGLIVYNGKSYGGSLGYTPTSRLSITASYANASSDTLSNNVPSKNHTEIYYTQLQYRLRQLNLLAGYTRFSQGISAAGTPAAAQNSYFIGVSRWINFF